MKPLFTENWFDIFDCVSRIDPELEASFLELYDDDNFLTLQQLFDKENFGHFDIFSDDYVRPDRAKIFKKLLRGKDVGEIILLALDLGRMLGRAEQLLLQEDTPCAR